VSYFISDEYQARVHAQQDFEGESHVKDEYQDEVYSVAHGLAKKFQATTILDVGCGGGFKLMKFFKDYDTTGVDLQPAIDRLKVKYPDRKWATTVEPRYTADIVICSDVIEHVDEPDALCDFIKSVKPKFVVLSTPDRDLVCAHHGQSPLGPPRNPTHVREWNFKEFEAYISSHFNVIYEFYSKKEQFTMCVIATPR